MITFKHWIQGKNYVIEITFTTTTATSTANMLLLRIEKWRANDYNHETLKLRASV